MPLGVLFLCAALPAIAARHGLWLEPSPQGAAEKALRETAQVASFDAPTARVEALVKLSDQNPGTATSGLARLLAGLLLLESNRPADAVPLLRHADIGRTAVIERARLALGRALDAKEPAAAADAYLAAADARADGPTLCPALFGAADALGRAAQHDRAAAVLQRALTACEKPRVLQALAKQQELKGDSRAAALALDQLDRDFPASAEAKESAPRLRALAAFVPATPPAERASRELKKGLLLFDAGRFADAAAVLRATSSARFSSGETDLVRARLGRAFLATGRVREAELSFASIRPGSAYTAEAAFHLAKLQVQRSRTPDAYEAFATKYPGSEWAEEALLALANHYQKDARDDEALPYYRRLLQGYPEGRYVERATWRVGWGDYRAGRFEDAAATMEKTVRQRSKANVTPGLLYWSGRARKELGQIERARSLFDETVRRYKHAYHGIRAREALAQLPSGPYLAPSEPEPAPPRGEIPEATELRVRQLFLIDRLDEAAEELRAGPGSPVAQATLAWIDSKRGRLRPAIIAMKRAYPEYIGEAGDALSEDVWRILYPLEFGDLLRAKAIQEGLDPALVAALVCQESTFDAGAVSSVGARGLMQIMPPTGRTLARSLGVAYNRSLLHRPETSLDFGTRYLRELMDQFGGRVERVLAGYNAGPHRVVAWTQARPDMPAEEFVESIPFTETRFYVMTILATQDHYRRLYALSADARLAAGTK